MRPRHWFACALIAGALVLPARSLAVVWIVDDPADPFPITGTLTLRQAIANANAMSGFRHDILFMIPGPGPHTIVPMFPLPTIAVDSVWINGYSQPGATPGAAPPGTATILIQLDGFAAGPCHGLVIAASFCTIEGIAVSNFGWDGIRVEGTPLPGTRSNTLFANFVGTDPTGMLGAGNGFVPGNIWAGIDILCAPGEITFCTNTLVSENLVSGNFRCGIQISSCPPSDCSAHQVNANWIGCDVSGLIPLGNLGSGVVLAEGTHDNIIQNNVIAANGANGVDITGNAAAVPPAPTLHNHFPLNQIGVAADGATALGNLGRGVSLGIFELQSRYGFCPENDFTSNHIAYNGMAGISVWELPVDATNADRNTFLRNSIHDNGGLGVDLGDDGVTMNDPADLDTGPNEMLNVPVIQGAVWMGGLTTISGSVDGGAEVHVYDARMDPTGCGEGMTWLGSVWPDPLGNWSLIVPGLATGQFVTALAMDWAAGTYSNTSEFATSRVVRQPGGVGGGSAAFALTVTGPNPFGSSVAFSCRLPCAGPADLRIHDASGRLVRTLVSAALAAGEHAVRWDGRDDRGAAVPPGLYFARLAGCDGNAVRKLVKRD